MSPELSDILRGNTPRGRRSFWQELRAAKGNTYYDPVFRSQVVLGHQQVRGLLGKLGSLSSAVIRPERSRGARREIYELGLTLMVAKDGSEWRRIRKPVNGYYRPGVMRTWQDTASELAEGLIEPFRHQGSVDFARDFADVFPLHLMMEMLGLPVEDAPQLKQLLDVVGPAFVDPFMHQPALKLAVDGTAVLDEYLQEAVRRHRLQPPEEQSPIMATFVRERDEGRLSDTEFLTNILFFLGTKETVRRTITETIALLQENPEQWWRLKNHPELIPSAAQEGLRMTTPLQSQFRIAQEPIQLTDGPEVPSGSLFILGFAAGNMDKSAFPNPEVFDVARFSDPHRPAPLQLAFGAGIHHCLGAPYVELVVEAALRVALSLPDLALRYPGLRSFKDSESFMLANGYTQLPLVFSPHTLDATDRVTPVPDGGSRTLGLTPLS